MESGLAELLTSGVHALERIADALERFEPADAPACAHPTESIKAEGPNGAVRFLCEDCHEDVTGVYLARLAGAV